MAKNKKKNFNVTIRSLIKKGVFVGTHHIDLTNAKDLGNKSWGNIDFLQKLGFSIDGKQDYFRKLRKNRKEDTIVIEKKEEHVIPIRSKSYHAYAKFLNLKLQDGEHESSEKQRFIDCLNIVNKFDNRVISQKTKLEKKNLKKLKIKNNHTFHNELIFDSSREIPLKQRK